MHDICLSNGKVFEVALEAKTGISSFEFFDWSFYYLKHSRMLDIFLDFFIIREKAKLATKIEFKKKS